MYHEIRLSLFLVVLRSSSSEKRSSRKDEGKVPREPHFDLNESLCKDKLEAFDKEPGGS